MFMSVYPTLAIGYDESKCTYIRTGKMPFEYLKFLKAERTMRIVWATKCGPVYAFISI